MVVVFPIILMLYKNAVRIKYLEECHSKFLGSLFIQDIWSSIGLYKEESNNETPQIDKCLSRHPYIITLVPSELFYNGKLANKADETITKPKNIY